MSRTRRVLAGALLGAVCAAAPATARAEVVWTPCTDPGFAAFECAHVGVPLDRTGATPGAVSLFVRRLRAPSNPTGAAVVALAGGPGQAAAPVAASFAVALAPALQTRDLLVFDQRGTGRSDPLRCPSLGSGRSTTRAVGACAAELGVRRAFHRTSDSVDDIEELRRMAGYAQLTLYGVSYGTKVALDYAARYPAAVERLVLDSVVPPEGVDTLQRSSFRAVSRVLRELCDDRRCRGVTPDPVRDVARLVQRDRAIRGSYVDARGRRRRAALAPQTIYPLLVQGDVNPAWRALAPGAIRSAVRGDGTPLVRLAAAALGGPGGMQVPDAADNDAVFVATICEETAFPWDRAAGPRERARQAASALLRVPASAFAPFDRETAAASGLLPVCVSWPNVFGAPAPPGALPPVPALVLAGRTDLRTPVEDSAATAARLPGAHVVDVPGTGHSVLGSDTGGCAGAAIAGFFGDRPVTACPPSAPPIEPLARPGRAVDDLPVTGGVRGRPGRALTAVLRTRDDALVMALGHRLGDGPSRFGGLRRGTITQTADAVVLRGVEHVRGVRVSGRFPSRGAARLTVRGARAARGRLTFHTDGRLTGRLGGRRISLRPVARTASAGRPRSAAAPLRPQDVLAHPRLARAAG